MSAQRPFTLLLLAPCASAQLALSPSGSIDITSLNLDNIGGLTYDADLGRLWVCDASWGNEVFEVDPLTGNPLFMFTADVIPGFDGGADSIALNPGTGELFLSSAFLGGPSEGIVTTGGQLVSAWATTHEASGATFNDAGELWVFARTPDELRQINPQTGALIQAFPASVASGNDLHALVADPLTGSLFAIGQGTCLLYEFDPLSGTLLSTTDLSPWYLGCVPMGMTFGPGGLTLYIGSAGSNTIDVYDRLGGTGSSYCSPAVPNSSGQAGTLFAIGSDVAGGNPLQLRMQGLPPNQFGYFLCSRTQGFTPLAGGSQGNLCLALPIGRFQAQLANSGPGGVIAIDVDTLALPLTPPVAALPGESWNFQGWYRDVNPNNTSNFTDAVEVVFQ